MGYSLWLGTRKKGQLLGPKKGSPLLGFSYRILQSFLIAPSGRVGLKVLCKKVRRELSRVDQRHRASQLRKQKKEAVRGVREVVWLLSLSRWILELGKQPWKGLKTENSARGTRRPSRSKLWLERSLLQSMLLPLPTSDLHAAFNQQSAV